MKFYLLCFLIAFVQSLADYNDNKSRKNSIFKYKRDGTKIHYFKWPIRYEWIAPSNYAKSIITIDGQYPGPKIEVDVGDTVIVDVINYLPGNFTIHWHGMLMKKTVDMDGVPFVTQDPIPPGGKYRYKFDVTDQAGTWWYHSHVGLDSAEASGPLIVREKKNKYEDLILYDKRYQYDEELILFYSEYRHKSNKDLLAGLKSKPFKWVGNPDAIMTNGRTYKVWDEQGKDNSTIKFNDGYNVLNIKKGKTYRLRIIGGVEIVYLAVQIPNHKLTVIEADGIYVEPTEVNEIQIMSGQRYSVIFTADQDIDNYFICAQQVGAEPDDKYGCGTGVSILHYEGAPNTDKLVKVQNNNVKYPAPPLTRWDERFHTSKWYRRCMVNSFYEVPKKIDRNIYLGIASGSDKDGGVYFTINNHKHIDRNTTLWNEIIDNTYDGNDPGVIDIREGERIQIVFEHFALNDTKRCVVHPWHLHGHSYYVVGHGEGEFNEKSNAAINRDLRTRKDIPILRDVFIHYPDSVKVFNQRFFSLPGQFQAILPAFENFSLIKPNSNIEEKPENYVSCGWYAIRFIADNPGVWYMHCHITPHLIMGKQVIINEKKRRPSYGYD